MFLFVLVRRYGLAIRASFPKSYIHVSAYSRKLSAPHGVQEGAWMCAELVRNAFASRSIGSSRRARPLDEVV